MLSYKIVAMATSTNGRCSWWVKFVQFGNWSCWGGLKDFLVNHQVKVNSGMPSWPRWSWWSLVTGSFGISTNIPWLGFWLSSLIGDLSCVAPIWNHATGRILKVWVSVVTSYCKKKVFWASGDEILQRYDRAKVFLVLVKIWKRASSARKLINKLPV